MSTINEIGARAFLIAQEAGWHDPRTDENGILRPTSTYERLALIHSEVTEALEAFRKFGPKEWHADGKPEGFLSELADIVIRTAELAEGFDFDLEVAILEKLAYNRKRSDVPNREGGKSI